MLRVLFSLAWFLVCFGGVDGAEVFGLWLWV